jgi:hypothetical protein
MEIQQIQRAFYPAATTKSVSTCPCMKCTSEQSLSLCAACSGVRSRCKWPTRSAIPPFYPTSEKRDEKTKKEKHLPEPLPSFRTLPRICARSHFSRAADRSGYEDELLIPPRMFVEEEVFGGFPSSKGMTSWHDVSIRSVQLVIVTKW